jgi:GAF domain-containing protein
MSFHIGNPGKPHRQLELPYWRERIASILLLLTTLAGAVFYIINMVRALQERQWEWIVTYSLLIVFLLLVTFTRRTPYLLKAGTLLTVLFLIALVSAIRGQPGGDAHTWFFGFTVLTTVLLGLYPGLVAMILSTVFLFTAGLSQSRLWIVFPELSNTSSATSLPNLILNTLVFFIVGTVATAALGVLLQQLQSSLEAKSKLMKGLEQENKTFENRAGALERREIQLRTAAEISRTLSSELDPSQLYALVVNLIKERFNLYYVGIFTMDDEGIYAVLQEGTGEEGKAMLEANHKLPIAGTSMIGWAISRRQPRIALDVGREAVRFDNPHLPETRSELALPLISGSRVLGAFTIQSKEAQAFDENDIAILQSIADGLAVALENASLFRQTTANLEEISRLHQQYLGESWAEVLESGEMVSHTYVNTGYKAVPLALQNLHQIVKPLLLRGQLIGSITLETSRPALTVEEDLFIDTIAPQAAQALENLRLMEELQRNAQRDRFLADLSGEIWASTDPETILKITISELVNNLEAVEGSIQLK